MRFIAIDTETTGFASPLPIEIAAQDIESKEWFCEKIRPTKMIDAAATAVHGMTKESLQDCRSLHDVLLDFFKFIRLEQEPTKVTFIAHNAAFDRKVLLNAIQECNVSMASFETVPWICTVQMSKQRFPLKFKPMTNPPEVVKHTLKDCCDRACIDQVDAHSALPDAKMCAQLQKDFLEQDIYAEALAEVNASQ